MNHKNPLRCFLALALLRRAHVVAYDHPLFLVSKSTASSTENPTKWCITVEVDENHPETNDISLQLCDFESAPKNQIWYRRDYEDFSTTALGDEPGTRCLGYDYKDEEKVVFLTSCDLENPLRTSWWQEYYIDDGTALQFQDYGEESLCMATEEADPQAGDKIRMLPCDASDGRVAWGFHYASCLPSVSYGYSIRLCVGSACAKYMEETNSIEMVDTNKSDIWLFDSRFDDALCMGTGLLRLERDPSLCLQQGHGGGNIRDGTWMRIYLCECNHPYQQFYCGEPGQSRTDPSLRMSVNNEGHRVILRTKGAPDSYPLMQQNVNQRHPLVLLSRRRGLPRRVKEGNPVVIQNPNDSSIICLFQQADGNLRILRSQTTDQCKRNRGQLIFHSGLSMKLAGRDSYVTQIQRDGNIVTRKTSTMTWAAWSTCSESQQRADYSLVLYDDDDTLAIMDENGRVTWKSDADKTCKAKARDPLVLMRSTDEQNTVRFGQERSIRDEDANSDICLVQQGDGNFRVLRVVGCGGNSGIRLFHSGLSQQLPNGEKYYTVFQKDGNLVTRKEHSGDWAWTTCHKQHQEGAKQEYSLVLHDDNSLSVLISSSGKRIWNAMEDPACFA